MTRRLDVVGLTTDCRSAVLVAAFILGGLMIGHSWAAAQNAHAGPEGGSAAERLSVLPIFPLIVGPSKRYLVDSAGTPFLIHGDAAWSLIAELTREEVERYLEDRHARGFNTIVISLIEAQFATNAPANAYGQQPFLVPGDYRTPNEAYFSHADWVLRRAAEKGFLVLLAPSYIGEPESPEGWYRAMVANGPQRLRQYGEYLGQRYRDFANILWVHGGDYSPLDKDLVRSIAEGIGKFDTRALHTAHGFREATAIDYWQGEPWLQVNNVYTSGPVYAPALAQYTRAERMPFFLIESIYENEHGATERQLRTQAYQAVLSGAGGQVFGNSPIWHFDAGRALYPAPVSWEEALESPGSRSMTHLHDLLSMIPWWLLEPDTENSLLTSGLGAEEERAVVARTSDRSLAVLYLPSCRDITVNLGQLAGPRIAARWYDPADGGFSPAGVAPFPSTGSRQFGLESCNNSSGFDDWVLVLESHS